MVTVWMSSVKTLGATPAFRRACFRSEVRQSEALSELPLVRPFPKNSDSGTVPFLKLYITFLSFVIILVSCSIRLWHFYLCNAIRAIQ